MFPEQKTVNCLIAPTMVGASLKMHETFNPTAVLQDLVDEKEPRANILMAVPTVYVKLMEEAEKQGLKKIDLDHMRMIVSGSGKN
jgi:acyl-CoA synthetase (AMP-forming)/AMP-acid ligase II